MAALRTCLTGRWPRQLELGFSLQVISQMMPHLDEIEKQMSTFALLIQQQRPHFGTSNAVLRTQSAEGVMPRITSQFEKKHSHRFSPSRPSRACVEPPFEATDSEQLGHLINLLLDVIYSF